ncbi:ribokinase [Vagococcus coleopterorum]|uniref:Ribokinase n=1 Tax=Vagococcus coleopterorum TaxID=2714946 RepID=A0A6G8AP10_9ENTE|nr:ribokinase [Vagococcus coleopterorum]QIL46811.1 ribokinase [Vagococcus coleopterorum]
MYDVTVLGSINIDTLMSVDRAPRIGETLVGNDVDYMLGGKGCNQAVAASRVGANVCMLGAVGADSFGEKALSYLSKESLDITQVKKDSVIFTGIATILKYPQDNSIIVIPGANSLVDEAYLESVEETIRCSKVLLLQHEIPLKIVEKSLKIAKKNKVMTILNPAPFSTVVSKWFDLIDVITPNEIEFMELCHSYFENPGTMEENMLRLSEKFRMKVIVTLGSKGIAYVLDGVVNYMENIKVTVQDTTGAGDTFNGILAAQLADDEDYTAALRLANVGASISTEKFGAQTGMPNVEEILSRLV